MKGIVITRGASTWRVTQAAMTGLNRMGYAAKNEAIGKFDLNRLKSYDILVSIGWKPCDQFINLYKAAFDCGIPAISISDGYVKRSADSIPRYSGGYWAVSLNGLNSYTRNLYHKCPSDRWEKLEIEMQPMKTDGAEIVIAHQHRPNWMGELRSGIYKKIMEAAQTAGRKIRIRYHPNHWGNKAHEQFKGYNHEHSQARRHAYPIEKDLKNAYCLATDDSNAATDAMIYGIPVNTVGKTIVDILADCAYNLNKRYIPYDDERLYWAYWMAYQQWTIEEIATGEPYDYLLSRHKIAYNKEMTYV